MHADAQTENVSKLYSDFSNNASSSIIPIETDSEFVITKSLLYDVTGKVRKDRVRLPTSILSDKPGAVPNEKVCNLIDFFISIILSRESARTNPVLLWSCFV